MSGLILLLSNLQSHVFLLNSRLGHFSAPTLRWDPFSRSYRVNLPSSLAMNHSSTFGYSPRPPVSVYGTGSMNLSLEGFLGSMLRVIIRLAETSRYYQISAELTDLPINSIPTFLQRTIPSVRRPFTSPSPHHSSCQYRNINLLSIGFALRLHLRSRLTLIRLSLIRKP